MINIALKTIREFHGINQTELASRLEISKSYLSEIESGRKKISYDLLELYSQIFDIPVSSLVFFSESIGSEGTVSDRFRSAVAKKILAIMDWMILRDGGDQKRA